MIEYLEPPPKIIKDKFLGSRNKSIGRHSLWVSHIRAGLVGETLSFCSYLLKESMWQTALEFRDDVSLCGKMQIGLQIGR